MKHVAIALFRILLRMEQFVVLTYSKYFYFPKVAKELDMLLNPKSVLDVGSGHGELGDALLKQIPFVTVMCADVENQHKGAAPFTLLEGTTYPFCSNSFDIVSICYVLHHIDDPRPVLGEAKRISKTAVVIYEDSYANRFEYWWYNLHVNSFRLTWKKSGGLAIRTDRDWQTLFFQEGFSIAERKRIHRVGYPVTRYRYVLVSDPLTESTTDVENEQ